MQTAADVSNMVNVILGSLDLPFVLFEMARLEMSKPSPLPYLPLFFFFCVWS